METKKIEATVSAEKDDDLCDSTAMKALKYHHVNDNNCSAILIYSICSINILWDYHLKAGYNVRLLMQWFGTIWFKNQ